MLPQDEQKISNPPRLCVIIPAYNEAEGLGGVLAVLRQVSMLDEIIVVDDGSQDDTSQVARQAAMQDTRLRLIQQPTNQGKGQAIFRAAATTHAPYLLLLDADLMNLNPGHVEDLIEPVLSGRAEMSIGLFRSGHLNTDLAHRATPWLSGQRCLKADLLKEIDVRAAAGYGFETALTISTHREHARTQVVYWTGVWHPPSEFHRGFWPGVWQRTRMYFHILRAWCTAQRRRLKLKQVKIS